MPGHTPLFHMLNFIACITFSTFTFAVVYIEMLMSTLLYYFFTICVLECCLIILFLFFLLGFSFSSFFCFQILEWSIISFFCQSSAFPSCYLLNLIYHFFSFFQIFFFFLIFLIRAAHCCMYSYKKYRTIQFHLKYG